MPTREELDALSSKELHDRATKLARHRLDVGFFWDLLKTIPAAEAASGNIGESIEDVNHIAAKVEDAFAADEGALADAMRPVYLDYLLEHEK